MRSASLNGSGRSSTASTTLNTAVLAPTPSAIVATATAVNPFAFSRERSASRITSDEVPLTVSRRRRGEASGGKRREIHLRIAAGDDVGEDAAGGGRMLKSLTAE